LAHRGGIDAKGVYFKSNTGDCHSYWPICIPPQISSLSIFILDVDQSASTFLVGPQRNIFIDSGDNRGVKGTQIVEDIISDLNSNTLDKETL